METLMFVPLICRRPESISAWRSSVRSSCSHSSYVLRSTQGEPTRTSVFVPTFVIYRLREWNYFFLKVPYKSVIDYLFQFPVLCSEFFKLTTCLCEMYPAKISLLPDELFKNLMASLEVGLSKYPFPLILLRYCYSKIDEILILDWESYLLYFHSYFRNEKKSSASLVAQSIVRPLLEKKNKRQMPYCLQDGPTSNLLHRRFHGSSRALPSSWRKDCVTSIRIVRGRGYPTSNCGMRLAPD